MVLNAFILAIMAISAINGFKPLLSSNKILRRGMFAMQLGQSADSKGMKPVPSGVPITFDFEVVAGVRGIDWGVVNEAFEATPGFQLYSTVAKFPLGVVVEEKGDGDFVEVTEVIGGKGGEAAGLQVGDVLRAFTACIIPKKANLVTEPVGALFTCDWRNPRLFEQCMEALVSNAEANGGPGKSIFVVERKPLPE